MEDNAAGKGLMTAIVEGVRNLPIMSSLVFLSSVVLCSIYFQRADMILGGIVMTASRFKKLNLPYPFVIGQFGFIIAMPGAQVNIAAVWKPFQQQVIPMN